MVNGGTKHATDTKLTLGMTRALLLSYLLPVTRTLRTVEM